MCSTPSPCSRSIRYWPTVGAPGAGVPSRAGSRAGEVAMRRLLGWGGPSREIGVLGESGPGALPARQGAAGLRRQGPGVDVDPGEPTATRGRRVATIQAVVHPFIRVEPPN